MWNCYGWYTGPYDGWYRELEYVSKNLKRRCVSQYITLIRRIRRTRAQKLGGFLSAETEVL